VTHNERMRRAAAGAAIALLVASCAVAASAAQTAAAPAAQALDASPPAAQAQDMPLAVQSPAPGAAAATPKPAAANTAVATATASTATDARAILDHVDDLFRGDSSHGRARMSVTTEHWKRALEMEFWSKGKDHSLIRITAPKKEEGTATLRSGNDLWNYLPKVKRVVKLPSSMLGASWMGSHFSNDDLVKESRMADDYDLSVTLRGVRDGVEVVEVTCIPRPDAAVVWGKIVVEVLAADTMPRRILYYDEDMKLARTLTYHDVATLGGRKVPARMLMQPADKPGESTEVLYLDIDFNVALPPDLFSLRTLQQ